MKARPIAGGIITEGAILTGRNYNVFNLNSYDEVERLGLASYFDRQTWEQRKRSHYVAS